MEEMGVFYQCLMAERKVERLVGEVGTVVLAGPRPHEDPPRVACDPSTIA